MKKKIFLGILLAASTLSINSDLNAWAFHHRSHMDPFFTGWKIIGDLNDMNDMFEEGLPNFSSFRVKAIYEKNDTLLIEIELPGFKKEEIKVTITSEGRLGINAKSKQKTTKEEEEERTKVYFRCRRFEREQEQKQVSTSIFLPYYGINPEKLNLDPKGMRLNYQNGILTIQIPMKKSQKPKSEEITLKFENNNEK